MSNFSFQALNGLSNGHHHRTSSTEDYNGEENLEPALKRRRTANKGRQGEKSLGKKSSSVQVRHGYGGWGLTPPDNFGLTPPPPAKNL